MSAANTAQSSSPASTEEITLRSVTVIVGVVVALTFIFGFGKLPSLTASLSFLAELVVERRATSHRLG